MRRPLFVAISAIVIAIIAIAVYVGRHRFLPSSHTSEPAADAIQSRVQDTLLTDLDGRQFRPGDYHGKVLLVNFWAAWCAPCAEEIPQFVALQNKYRDQGLQIVGVSVEDIESELRAFCTRNHVNYPVVPGNQTIADSFGGVLGLPTTILIGRDGAIYKKYPGATDFSILEQDFRPLLAAAH
jgi:thiol-disulfide isomerase/thioredoxin